MLMEKEKDMGEVDQSVYYSGPCRPGEEFDFYSKCDGKSVEDLRERTDTLPLLACLVNE